MAVMLMAKNDIIREDALDSVNGGAGTAHFDPPPKCKFKKKTGIQEPFSDGGKNGYKLECEEYCFVPICKCHGTQNCVDRWHRFTTLGTHFY